MLIYYLEGLNVFCLLELLCILNPLHCPRFLFYFLSSRYQIWPIKRRLLTLPVYGVLHSSTTSKRAATPSVQWEWSMSTATLLTSHM